MWKSIFDIKDMNKNFIDLTGKKFGRLTVIKRVGQKGKRKKHYWLCNCNCGNEKTIIGDSLRNGLTKSCGCLQKEKTSKTSTKHMMSFNSEYRIWANMKARCYNKNANEYKNYGGRGIKICENWKNDFMDFYKDMGDRPKGLTLDRIDNNKGYYKENCRWITYKKNNRNRRDNRMITYKGETKCLSEWAEKINIYPQTLWHRLNSGWDIERAISN